MLFYPVANIDLAFVDLRQLPRYAASLGIEGDADAQKNICAAGALEGLVIDDLNWEIGGRELGFNIVVEIETLVFKGPAPNRRQVHQEHVERCTRPP